MLALLLLLLLRATSVFLLLNCTWRFESCDRAGPTSEHCLMQLRRWCRCGGTARPPCQCSGDALFCATAATTAANATADMAEFCDLSSCSVVERPCEWSPWQQTMDLEREGRQRYLCCHPESGSELRKDCGFDSEIRTCGQKCAKPGDTPNNEQLDPHRMTKVDFKIPVGIALGVFFGFSALYLILKSCGGRGREPQREENCQGNSGEAELAVSQISAAHKPPSFRKEEKEEERSLTKRSVEFSV